mmetsp:Transcript_50134/g.158700  ORF Transcript_50134/g.158700 Transcript_50134/m.158700 type:complete len:286 (+) Transcript_50134:218-1075(+)
MRLKAHRSGRRRGVGGDVRTRVRAVRHGEPYNEPARGQCGRGARDGIQSEPTFLGGGRHLRLRRSLLRRRPLPLPPRGRHTPLLRRRRALPGRRRRRHGSAAAALCALQPRRGARGAASVQLATHAAVLRLVRRRFLRRNARLSPRQAAVAPRAVGLPQPGGRRVAGRRPRPGAPAQRRALSLPLGLVPRAAGAELLGLRLGRRRGEGKGAGIEAERPLRAPLAMVLVAMVLVGHCHVWCSLQPAFGLLHVLLPIVASFLAAHAASGSSLGQDVARRGCSMRRLR